MLAAYRIYSLRHSKEAQSMIADQSKASREMQVFPKFLQKSELPIGRDSVENRTPAEPDILCRHKEQSFIAFEMVVSDRRSSRPA
jgi:hypothetical protein